MQMSTMSISGGGNHNVTVYGSGNVISGNGNDSIRVGGSGNILVGNGRDTIAVMGSSSVVAGSGNDTIHIAGVGRVSVGGGNDSIRIGGIAHVSVGAGNDTLTLSSGGEFTQTGLHGHDTITLGMGNDTIYEQGNATIHAATEGSSAPKSGSLGQDDLWHTRQGSGTFQDGAARNPPAPGTHAYNTFGGATISGGELQVLHSHGVTVDMAVSGKMTLVGGHAATEFVGGSGSTVMRGGAGNDTFVGGKGSTVMRGGSGNDTFVGGSGHDTMTGGSGHNVFEFLASKEGGQHVITNFVSSDQLDVEGHSLDYLSSHHEVTTRDGNTYISVDGGKTTIELHGVSETDPTRQPHPIYPHDTFGK
jgi:Ca2+-binding RTX toxin-like protein